MFLRSNIKNEYAEKLIIYQYTKFDINVIVEDEF